MEPNLTHLPAPGSLLLIAAVLPNTLSVSGPDSLQKACPAGISSRMSMPTTTEATNRANSIVPLLRAPSVLGLSRNWRATRSRRPNTARATCRQSPRPAPVHRRFHVHRPEAAAERRSTGSFEPAPSERFRRHDQRSRRARSVQGARCTSRASASTSAERATPGAQCRQCVGSG